MARLTLPRDPITIHFDGAPIVADRGEPAAVALVAAGHLGLSRSPKFHRPRGPSCLRGACDGCLARVDDVPNVMTCRVPATAGMRIETQNVVGFGQTDLLRAADWFFPEGMNHHELLAGVPGMQRILQGLARRVSGSGRLPTHASAPKPATRRAIDALVVGAGPAGMAAAVELSKRRRQVEVIDDALTWGGCLRALDLRHAGLEEGGWRALSSAFEDAVDASRIVLRTRTTAAGVYGDDVLVANENEVEVVTARTLVLAPGAHDGALAFENNDVPGVMSARAGCFFVAHGVSVGKKIVVAVTERAGLFGAAFGRAVPEAVLVHGVPIRTKGSARVREVTFAADGGDERRLACDALLVDVPGAPAYELCAQAGAELAHEARGFVVKAHGGRIREGVFASGEVVGTPLDPHAILGEAVALADRA